MRRGDLVQDPEPVTLLRWAWPKYTTAFLAKNKCSICSSLQMPHGGVRKGAKHAGGKLTIERDAESDASHHSKQHRQKLRHANQKSADDMLDEMLAEQLQGKPKIQENVLVAAQNKPEENHLALALTNCASATPCIFSDACPEDAGRSTHVASCPGPAGTPRSASTQPMSFGPLRDATGATYTPRSHSVVASCGAESAVPEHAVSDVQQLHNALPNMLAKALEQQLAPLVDFQHKQSSRLQAFEKLQNDIVSRLERLERDKDSNRAGPKAPSPMFHATPA
eukprot:6487388-Amphidinium_carterae.1